jgi:type I restriction enzyme S subunit
MDIDIHYPDDLSEQLSIVARLDAAFAHVDSLKANAEKQLAEARQLFQAELAECMRPKEGWEEKTLGSICKVINGRAYSKDEMLKQGKYRLLRVGNFFTNDSWYYSDLELEEDKYCEKGDLLFAWSASFGPRIWDGEKVIYHYHIWKMVCSSVVDKYFMFYWLDSDELKKQTMSNLHGATMAHITKGIIEAALVSYPSIELQYQIVSRLDALSANIKKLEEVQRKTLAECDALKQAMLREVFE